MTCECTVGAPLLFYRLTTREITLIGNKHAWQNFN